jgi:hypothetical protein
MIVEFALTLVLSLPTTTAPVVQVEFSEPVTRVITYPDGAVLNQLSGLALPDGTREAFEDDFATGEPFFGAFAITKDFGYGYVTGANSLEAAREIAIAECMNQGPRCLVYAELLPDGYEPLESGQVSLAPEAAQYYTDPDPSWGNYRAMAISEDGAYSVVWNYGSPAEAAAAALSDCTEYVIIDLVGLRLMPCILIPFK